MVAPNHARLLIDNSSIVPWWSFHGTTSEASCMSEQVQNLDLRDLHSVFNINRALADWISTLFLATLRVLFETLSHLLLNSNDSHFGRHLNGRFLVKISLSLYLQLLVNWIFFLSFHLNIFGIIYLYHYWIWRKILGHENDQISLFTFSSAYGSKSRVLSILPR